MTGIDTLIDMHSGTHVGIRTGITDTINMTDIMIMRVVSQNGLEIMKHGLVTVSFSGNYPVWYWSVALNRGSLTSVDMNVCVGQ